MKALTFLKQREGGAAEYNEIERMTRLFGQLGPRSPKEMGA